MYQIGDKVLYGSTGVCQVVELREQALPATGEKCLYYVLRNLYEDCVISAPVGSDKVFIRPIISREEAEQIIREMPQISAAAYSGRAARELTAQYESALKSHDCRSLVGMTKSLYSKKQQLLEKRRRVGSVDERFLKRAENLLFGELAAALELPRDQVQGYITSRLEPDKVRGEAV